MTTAESDPVQFPAVPALNDVARVDHVFSRVLAYFVNDLLRTLFLDWNTKDY